MRLRNRYNKSSNSKRWKKTHEIKIQVNLKGLFANANDKPIDIRNLYKFVSIYQADIKSENYLNKLGRNKIYKIGIQECK